MELTAGDGAGDRRSRETGLMADVNQRDALTTYASSAVMSSSKCNVMSAVRKVKK